VGDNETAEGRIEITLGEDEPEYIFSRSFKTVKLNGGGFSSQYGDLQLKENAVATGNLLSMLAPG